jgi:hypothetical protein
MTREAKDRRLVKGDSVNPVFEAMSGKYSRAPSERGLSLS